MNRRGFLSLCGFGAVALATPGAIERELLAGVPTTREQIDALLLPAPVPLEASAPLAPGALEEAAQRLWLGFAPERGLLTAEPGQVVSLAAYPQRAFRPDRLIVEANEIASWEVLDVLNAGQPTECFGGGVPAELFSLLTSSRVPWGAVMPGEQIVLAMRNVSQVRARLRNAAMMGTSLAPRCEHCDGQHYGAYCPITYPGTKPFRVGDP